jgi:hypothetical protein
MDDTGCTFAAAEKTASCWNVAAGCIGEAAGEKTASWRTVAAGCECEAVAKGPDEAAEENTARG